MKGLVGKSDGERVFGERTLMLNNHIMNIRIFLKLCNMN